MLYRIFSIENEFVGVSEWHKIKKLRRNMKLCSVFYWKNVVYSENTILNEELYDVTRFTMFLIEIEMRSFTVEHR